MYDDVLESFGEGILLVKVDENEMPKNTATVLDDDRLLSVYNKTIFLDDGDVYSVLDFTSKISVSEVEISEESIGILGILAPASEVDIVFAVKNIGGVTSDKYSYFVKDENGHVVGEEINFNEVLRSGETRDSVLTLLIPDSYNGEDLYLVIKESGLEKSYALKLSLFDVSIRKKSVLMLDENQARITITATNNGFYDSQNIACILIEPNSEKILAEVQISNILVGSEYDVLFELDIPDELFDEDGIAVLKALICYGENKSLTESTLILIARNEYEQDEYTLAISAETGGMITTGTSGLYAPDQVIDIAVTPDKGYIFTGWTASTGIFGNANSAITVFIMPDSDVEIIAHFERIPDDPDTFSLDISASIGGAISVGEAGLYKYGQEVEIVATPDDGYSFNGWTSTAGTFANASSVVTVFTMPGRDAAIIANFEPLPIEPDTFILTIYAGAGGTVSGGGAFEAGAYITVTATPNNDYSFDGWYENDVKIQGAGETYSFTVTEDRALEARFIKGDSPAGVKVKGMVKSYYPKNETKIQLMDGETEKFKTTIPAETTGSGQTEQSFTFENVGPGTYTLVVTKSIHTKYTIHNIVVGDNDVNLADDVRPLVQLIVLPCGDVDENGFINTNDLNMIWSSKNYLKAAADAENPLCDLDGDGFINSNDLSIVWSSENYGKGPIVVN
jgi:hypothetical protein